MRFSYRQQGKMVKLAFRLAGVAALACLLLAGLAGPGEAAPRPPTVAAGLYHNLGILASGQVTAWGLNHRGQCNVPPGLGRALTVAAGDFHSLALKPDGTVVAWGDNSFGQCNMPPGLGGVVAVAACATQSLALKADGTVVAWGITPMANATCRRA